MRRRLLGIAGVLCGCLLLAGLAGYLVAVGLDGADKIASVISAFVGLVGLALGVFELLRRPADLPAVSNTYSGDVSGTVIQAGILEGDINLRG